MLLILQTVLLQQKYIYVEYEHKHTRMHATEAWSMTLHTVTVQMSQYLRNNLKITMYTAV